MKALRLKIVLVDPSLKFVLFPGQLPVEYITYKTKDGEFITFDSALIEYNPIMPDQVSPFRIITPYNPLMETAFLEFQFLSGEKISHYFD